MGTNLTRISWPRKLSLPRISLNFTEVNFAKNISLTSLLTSTPCTHLVLAIGQWHAGWPNFKPYTVTEYRAEMTTLARAMVAAKSASTTLRSVSLRALNYNPLGGMQAACPATDWRSPPMIDAYNSQLKALVAEVPGIDLIDIGPIVGPMW